MEKEILICEDCGCELENNIYEYGDNYYCEECFHDRYFICDNCGESHNRNYVYVDNRGNNFCEDCYYDIYTYCENCGEEIEREEALYYDGSYYCEDCYNECCKHPIHDYYYKPDANFHGEMFELRYFGVELEIDGAGEDNDNAENILDFSERENLFYIKHDGSLHDGMEIVTHPCTLDFHNRAFPWEKICEKALDMGYKSHNTGTCGLHVHVSRKGLGNNEEEQGETISRILYFVENFWNEMLIFSRRTEEQISNWAARYGKAHNVKAQKEHCKEYAGDRYRTINLCNTYTVEFRLFRGTLKSNTVKATIQMVNAICDACQNLTDFGIENITWKGFTMAYCNKYSELAEYLRSKGLYTEYRKVV